METLYRKVVIKSEDDLPKVDGEYYVHYKEYGMGSTHIYLGNEARKYTWLNGIDWYLLPIEQDQQENNKRKKLKKYLNRVIDSIGEDQQAPFKDVYVEKNDPIRQKLNELQQAPEKSADQILAKWEGHEGLSLNDDRVRTGRMRVIAAMKEYANQFRSEQRQEISNEEIENYFYVRTYYLSKRDTRDEIYQRGFVEGAKWMRDKLTKR